MTQKPGAMLLEGIWKGNKLVEIIRKIEESIMIEFKRNGDNTITSNRIPVFVGEFVYDEEKESFLRNGRGYWIDEETRIATREVEWKDGMEVSGRDLYDGWYTRFITISSFSILMVESHCISYCFVNHIKPSFSFVESIDFIYHKTQSIDSFAMFLIGFTSYYFTPSTTFLYLEYHSLY